MTDKEGWFFLAIGLAIGAMSVIIELASMVYACHHATIVGLVLAALNINILSYSIMFWNKDVVDTQ